MLKKLQFPAKKTFVFHESAPEPIAYIIKIYDIEGLVKKAWKVTEISVKQLSHKWAIWHEKTAIYQNLNFPQNPKISEKFWKKIIFEKMGGVIKKLKHGISQKVFPLFRKKFGGTFGKKSVLNLSGGFLSWKKTKFQNLE